MRAHNEEMLRAARTHYRLFPMLPTTWNKFKMEWSNGPGTGWWVRTEVRRVKRALEAQGFDVTLCRVGRAYLLVRAGVVAPRDQDRFGMAAKPKAQRRSLADGLEGDDDGRDGDDGEPDGPGGGGSGDRSPRTPIGPTSPSAAALDLPAS